MPRSCAKRILIDSIGLASRYDEARVAYSHSSKPYMAARILEDLCTTAIRQQKFMDAAYLCYQMAHVVLQVLGFSQHYRGATEVGCGTERAPVGHNSHMSLICYKTETHKLWQQD
jgi:hypothetical protein